jgi:hypothetical protein
MVLKVASTDMGFGSTLSDAVYHYHSIYDSQLFQETYADPSFHKHVSIIRFYKIISSSPASIGRCCSALGIDDLTTS